MKSGQSVKIKIFADHEEVCSKEIRPPAEVEAVGIHHFKVIKDEEPAQLKDSNIPVSFHWMGEQTQVQGRRWMGGETSDERLQSEL